MNKLLATVVISAGLAAGVPSAYAQSTDAQNAPQTRAAPRAEGMQRHHAQQPRLSAAQRVEARLAYIRTALKITDGQQAQWDAFATVLRNQAKQADEWRAGRRAQGAQGQAGQRYTAIDRLERRQKMMTVASQRLAEVVEAAKPLYAALSPEQQQIADDLMARQGHGRMGHHHGMRRGA